MRVYPLLATLIVSATIATATVARDGQWFEHRFGEQRAYFGDWLAVCDDSGAGQCRLVQEPASDAPDADFYRIALVLLEDNDRWSVELSARNMPAADLQKLEFAIDDDTISGNNNTWKQGDNVTSNIADTVTLTDGELIDLLLTGMRDGLNMVVSYEPAGTGLGSFDVPLRGVTAGTGALKAIYAKR